jgi:restriction endonuclease S subunit/predicted ATPase
LSELPDGWIYALLADIAQWGSGGTPSRNNPAYYSGSIPWIKTGELGQGTITDTEEKITELGLQNSSAKIFPKGSVAVAMYGATIGKTAILGIDAATNQACAVGIPREGGTTTEYLFHYLASQKDAFIEVGQGGAQPNISQTVIKNWSIPLAPLNEQKRIADKLDALLARVDACREQLDRVPVILKRFRQAVLVAATSGQLTEEWRAEQDIEEGWTAITVKAVANVVRGASPRPAGDPRYFGGAIPWITVGEITKDQLKYLDSVATFVTEEGKSRSRFIEAGSLLLTNSGATLGVPKITRISGCINDGSVALLGLNEPLKSYLYFVLASKTHELRKINQGAAQPNLNTSIVKDIEFQLPNSEIERHEIVCRVETLFAYADRLEIRYKTAHAQVDQLTSALLAKAFRGELVLQEPNDEPASFLLERIQSEKNRVESEQKTTRIVRRPSRKVSEILMKQSPDYLEALRSAFGTLGKKADAHQLFNQGGFSSEEVVQFYEALRAAPEVRDAFKKITEERPSTQQSSIANSVDNRPIENGRFRLIDLWLEDFKNLADYTVRFDPSHSIDIVLGWNGTGKSNLFEALVIIFRDLHIWCEKNQWPKKPMKGYGLRYIMEGQIVEVFWRPREMKRPKLRMGILQEEMQELTELESITRDKLPLPRFIFGYYSGPTNRLAEHFLTMKQDHYIRLRDATSDDPETLNHLLEKRQFFCAENHHAKYVLLAFCHKEDAYISQFLEDRLRIVGFESALFVIRKPRWAKKGQTAEDFWGASGVMRRVMERLRRFAIAPMVVKQNVPDGFRLNREDHYYFFLPDLQSLHAFAAEYHDARTFFLALESTDFSELIYDVKIQVRVKATNTEQVPITFHELSEGEQQLLMVLGLMRFTKSHQSLVLLDEPDTHLNPHWSVEYLKLLTRVMSEGSSESEEQQTSQILMSTHDPLVIASLFKEQIHLLKRDWQTGICKWTQPTVNPRGLGFTGILTSEMFGMRSDLDEETLADLDNKVRLIAKEGSLTPDEVAELEEINKRLEDAGFQKAFSDPYYAAFASAWGQRHSQLMAGVRFLNQEQQEEIARIAREVLDEVMAEMQSGAAG